MLFNIDKCSVIHVGRKNRGFEYEMGDRKLRTTEEEKDRGVIIQQRSKTIKAMQRSSDQSKHGTGTDQKSGNQQRQKHLLEPVQNSGQTPLGVFCSSMESVHKHG